MSALSYAVSDTMVAAWRNLLRIPRQPDLLLSFTVQPIMFLLLFAYVFGGTLGNGLGGAAVPGTGGRDAYVDYLTPAILLITVTSAVLGTAISVAQDMTEGIIARFRTMAISRASVLTGHVIGTVIQTVIGLVVVTAVALLVGFSPTANVGEWLAVAGLLLLLTVALTWLSVAMGLAAKSVETASNTPMIFMLLPLVGSGFVPIDSMPDGLAWFAEYQPFTPVVETMRGLLFGTEIGNSGWFAVGWCVLLGVLGYAWSKSLFGKERIR